MRSIALAGKNFNKTILVDDEDSEHFHDCREHETEFVEKKEPN